MDTSDYASEKSLIFLEQLSDYSIKRCEDLLSKELPFDESRILIKTFLKAVEVTKEKMKKLRKNLNKYPKDEVKEQLTNYGKTLYKLHSFFVTLEPLGRENISQASIYLMEHITSKIDSKKTKFVFVPSYEFDFSITDFVEEMKSLLNDQEFDESVAKSDDSNPLPKIYLLEFPFVYKDNIVINSMIAHEIGHYICYQSLYKSNYTTESNQYSEEISSILTSLSQKIWNESNLGQRKRKKAAQRRLGDLTPSEIRKKLTKLVEYLISSNVEEIVSDYVGLKLVGPVYMISLFYLLVGATSEEELYGTHPNFYTRMKILLNHFKETYKEYENQELQDIVSSIISFVTEYKRPDLEELGPVPRIVFKKFNDVAFMPEGVPTMNEGILKILNEFPEKIANKLVDDLDLKDSIEAYDPANLESECSALIEILKASVPPAEIKTGSPARIPSILNAGILYKNKDDLVVNESGEDRTSDYTLLIDRLVLKGVELSSIQSQFLKTKETIRNGKRE